MPHSRLAGVVSLLILVAGLSFGQEPHSSGSLTVRYTLSRLARIASNQYAIWIEDEGGRYITTLFVTDFVARRGGWKLRPQALPAWVKAAKVRSLPERVVDAVSGATPGNGPHSVVWDLRDSQGGQVPPGLYRYLVEANIFWDERVLWTGVIRVDEAAHSSLATPTYTAAKNEKSGTVISEVSAEYLPAHR